MGFNNGYDSGYEDARAELEPKMAALEKRVKELEVSGGSSGYGSQPSDLGGGLPPVFDTVTGAVIAPSHMVQVLASSKTDSPVYDTDTIPLAVVSKNTESYIIEEWPDNTILDYDGTMSTHGYRPFLVIPEPITAFCPDFLSYNDVGAGIYLMKVSAGTWEGMVKIAEITALTGVTKLREPASASA